MRGAFGYEGEVLEMGYPRNDLLFAADRDEVRAGVRARLGVPEEARAVLYAPTWRDDAAFSTALDLTGLAAALGDAYVLLVRAHSAVAATLSLHDGPRVRNVSDVDDVGELLLAADVLVTDYSSVMFDFAPLRKPMLFFTYDLERYRDELRGFYIDFEAEVPGPLLATTPELADALRDVDAVGARYAQAHERFVERYCDLDDGRAAARVVDAVFGV
jgi:CDP-glycerol glycerophosphotransferase